MGRLTAPQLLIISFLCVILLGTVLLNLPLATRGEGRMPLVNSLFTATSATCVTGLIVEDTGTYFSKFGKWVIFALFQAGGLGIMTFSTLFAVLLGRKIGFNETDVVKATLDRHNILGLKKLVLYILSITLTFEILGAALLFFRWRMITDWSLVETLEQAVFHSVSGFCNAGFSLFKNSFINFENAPVINLTMIGLIFFGGIGFIVIMDLVGLFFKGGSIRRMSLQSKVALTVSLVLIIVGTLFFMVFERNNVMSSMTWQERTLGSFFQSVTARTTGFNSLPIGKLSVPSLGLLIFLMFIGASPGSTGGGIKTCTFAVIIAAVVSFLGNKKKARLFNRSITQEIIREALVIFFLAIAWIFIATVLISFFEGNNLGQNGLFMKSLFEVVSAFGTVGLSTGITSGLTAASKICLIVTMFAGRVGPMTLALAIAFKERKEIYTYPEESVMVG